jgi:hypothetical protein
MSRTLNYVDAITKEMSDGVPSALLREVERLLGDSLPQGQSSVRISLVLSPDSSEADDQSLTPEEEHTEAEPDNPEQRSSTTAQEPAREASPQPNTPRLARHTPKAKSSLTSDAIPSRQLFTDGWNSFWHFVLGLFANKFPILIPICIVYQVLDSHDVNVFVDIIEFIYGHFIGMIFGLLR